MISTRMAVSLAVISSGGMSGRRFRMPVRRFGVPGGKFTKRSVITGSLCSGFAVLSNASLSNSRDIS